MGLWNIVGLALIAQPAWLSNIKTSLFFSFFAIAVFLLIQFLGARFYTGCKERYTHFPLIFFIILATLSVLSLVLAFFLRGPDTRLFAGVVGGVFLWTSLGEISEHMGWYAPHARGAVWLFLLSTAAWLILAFLIPGTPVPILGFIGYPLLTWGTLLTRVRVLDKWGVYSFASTLLLLIMAAFSGGSLVAGILFGTKFAGLLAGLVFAVTAWSIMEIIWERGMANGPWKHRDQ